MWWMLLSPIVLAGPDEVRCRQKPFGWVDLTWLDGEALRMEERERAQREGRAVDPVAEHGVFRASISRLEGHFARGDAFDWYFVVGDETLALVHGQPVQPVPPPPDLPKVRAWKTRNTIEIPAGLPTTYDLHVVDTNLLVTCAVHVDGVRRRIKRRRGLLPE